MGNKFTMFLKYKLEEMGLLSFRPLTGNKLNKRKKSHDIWINGKFPSPNGEQIK